ncbi:hypothetical protein [Natronosalvus rutilus]|uniref:Uncharacterized protein n=1 Tax=Natronosalvus rutilus TaxID=2953753 RepID=A0A9E7NC70_9EURY|nr:hypothetical protein [Natronosalvus rutilus]UTF54289.1 hypothetical protein NGM29_03125 [Natronosalvus rutilus]
MPQPPIWDSLWGFLENDTNFYYAIGFLTIAIFVAAFVAVSLISSVDLTQGGFLGIVAGFSMFMLVFFISIFAQRLEGQE